VLLSVGELSGQDVAFPLTVTVTVQDVCLHRDAVARREAARRELWHTRHTLGTRCLTPARRSIRIPEVSERAESV